MFSIVYLKFNILTFILTFKYVNIFKSFSLNIQSYYLTGESAANNTLMKTLWKQYMNKQHLKKIVKKSGMAREVKP